MLTEKAWDEGPEAFRQPSHAHLHRRLTIYLRRALRSMVSVPVFLWVQNKDSAIQTLLVPRARLHDFNQTAVLSTTPSIPQMLCVNLEPEEGGRAWYMDNVADVLFETIKGVTPLYDSLVRFTLLAFTHNGLSLLRSFQNQPETLTILHACSHRSSNLLIPSLNSGCTHSLLARSRLGTPLGSLVRLWPTPCTCVWLVGLMVTGPACLVRCVCCCLCIPHLAPLK